MLKSVTIIGLAVISTLMVLEREAIGWSISGTGGKGFSALTLTVAVKGVGNCVDTDCVVRTTVRAESADTVEFICLNPNGNGTPAGPGEAGLIDTVIVEDISAGIISKGKATVELTLDLTSLEIPENCVNENWIPVPNSAGLLSYMATHEACQCNGTGVDPCINEDSELTCSRIDIVIESCSIPQINRNPDYTTQHNHVFTCVEH